jgi:hypothetical protein
MSSGHEPWLGLRRTWVGLLCLRTVIAAAVVFCPGCQRGKAQLRVHNETSTALQQLEVIFPRETVKFGDVGAGTLSASREARHGVGQYASFRFVVNGTSVRQDVADFVGWKPLSGAAFTYRVSLKPGRSQPFLDIVAVERDR